jgi:hypothetical protein
MSLESLHMYGNGPCFEVVGYSRLSAVEREALYVRIRDACLARDFAVGGGFESGALDIIGDRSSGFPDVRIETIPGDRLVACDFGPAERKAWSFVRNALAQTRGLRVERLEP